MSTNEYRYYDVTFTSDLYRFTATVSVPDRDDDDPAYSDDDSAIDIAAEILSKQNGFDVLAYCHDIIVEPAF